MSASVDEACLHGLLVCVCVLAAFVVSSVDVQGDTVKFEIWDTAGQERYHSLAPMYYRGAQAAIVTYDISNPVSSFLHG